MGSARIEFHYDGFNELRRSYQAEIDSFGEGAAASANAMTSQDDGDEDRGGRKRSAGSNPALSAKLREDSLTGRAGNS